MANMDGCHTHIQQSCSALHAAPHGLPVPNPLASHPTALHCPVEVQQLGGLPIQAPMGQLVSQFPAASGVR